MTKEIFYKFIEAIKKLRGSIDDETAISAPGFFKPWDQNGEEYAAGDRVQYGGKLYKVLTSHISQPTWAPDVAVSLFAEVLAGQDGTDIGEWVQPDSTNPYMKGDKVTHNGKTWVSDIDNNVWEPGVYGWSEVTEGGNE